MEPAEFAPHCTLLLLANLVQEMLAAAEANNGKLGKDLEEAAGVLAERDASLISMRASLETAKSDLDQANRAIQDKDAKVQPLCG